MRDSKHQLIHRFYHHIDNGGISLEVYDSDPSEEEGTFSWVTLSESFHGYATGSLTFHNQGSDFLRKLGEACITAASKLDDYAETKAARYRGRNEKR